MKLVQTTNDDILQPFDNGRDDPVVWRCYSCGNTSDDKTTNGFHQVTYDTACGYEYDTECGECGSLNTFFDGEGEPECEECSNLGWYCYKCNKSKCGECWTWFVVEKEPKDYVCPDCQGVPE
jgi:hypothetical protein